MKKKNKTLEFLRSLSVTELSRSDNLLQKRKKATQALGLEIAKTGNSCLMVGDSSYTLFSNSAHNPQM